MGREIVGLFLPDRLIVDLQIGVVAEPFGVVDEFPRGDVEFLVVKHRPIDEIHRPFFAQSCDRLEILFQVRITVVCQFDERLDGNELHFQPSATYPSVP